MTTNTYLGTFVLLTIIGVATGACGGCEKTPVYPPINTAGAGGTGSGGASPSSDPCYRACGHLERLDCELARPLDGVTCEQLCRQIPNLKANANCVAEVTSCEEVDACTTGEAPQAPRGIGGSAGTRGAP